jgi:predicted nucleic acid-binding protein
VTAEAGSLAGYLLDTNVISETRKPKPDPGVLAFLNTATGDTLFLSVLTLGELRKGVEAKRKTNPVTASRLSAWVDDIEQTFADRVLPIDLPAARIWGEISGASRPLPVIDALIAATALAYKLTLVTRNVADMKPTGVPLINPWS